MGKIISFLNPKGGVGKSTCTQNIAICFHKHWKKVLIIDADPGQQTLKSWEEKTFDDADYPKVVVLDERVSFNEINKLKEKFDYIFIDNGAKTDEFLLHALKISDMVIIPIQPSGVDIEGAEPLIKMIKSLKKQKGLIACFLINADEPNVRLSKEINHGLVNFDIPLLNHRISRSVRYAETLMCGSSVFDIKNKRIDKLTNEITLLSKEIKEMADG